MARKKKDPVVEAIDVEVPEVEETEDAPATTATPQEIRERLAGSYKQDELLRTRQVIYVQGPDGILNAGLTPGMIVKDELKGPLYTLDNGQEAQTVANSVTQLVADGILVAI